MEYVTKSIVAAQNRVHALRDEESGQTLVEYALIISLIALVCIGALVFLGGEIRSIFSQAGSQL